MRFLTWPFFVLALSACGSKPIPAHLSEAQVKAELDAADPARFLVGGTRVFFDDFNRDTLGERWVTERLKDEPLPSTWQIKDGWLYNDDAKNQGLWAEIIPTTGTVRIEFSAVSSKDSKGRFVGDLKCEAFATGPGHEKGYSFINGGWSNKFDTIAKLGEHSADDKRKPSLPVVEDKVHRYAIIVTERQLHFLRDGDHLYTFDDPQMVRGPWFGFNNWLTNARFDDLAVYTLP